MSLITTTRREEQCSKNNCNDENTSDDSLLLMADYIEEKAPLLNIIDDDFGRDGLISSNDIPLQPRLSTSHCHVPDDKFDYNARNRLIIVLILCIIFMLIEIVGMLLFIETNDQRVIDVYLGGILSNSTAVATDAAHMCIDATSFLISLTALYLATKRPTQRLSFGYIRAGIINIRFSSGTYEGVSFRGSWSSRECTDYMGSYWYSCLYGYSTLY
jgi:hypothetical protein